MVNVIPGNHRGLQMLDRRHMDTEPDQRTALVVYTDLQEPCN